MTEQSKLEWTEYKSRFRAVTAYGTYWIDMHAGSTSYQLICGTNPCCVMFSSPQEAKDCAQMIHDRPSSRDDWFNLSDVEQAPYHAPLDLSELLRTYESLLSGDKLPERIAVQTVDLRALLEAAHPFSLTMAREQAYAHATRIAETYINGEYEAQGCAAQMIFDELRMLAKPKPSASIRIYLAKIIDELSVDNFTLRMKRKLAKKRAEGRGGWQNMNGDELSDILHQLVAKGDPVDVANLCMMLSENGQHITHAEPTQGEQSGITISALQTAHIKRQKEWCPDQQPDLSFRGNEMAGEVGEACNVIKKLERERQGWRGSRSTKDELANELADVIHTAILCAITAGIDLEAATVEKFNATSDKNDLRTRLPAAPTAEAAQDEQTTDCALCSDTKEIQRPDSEFLSPCPECAPTSEAGK